MEAPEPAREFSRHKEAWGFAGWYYSVSVGDHVGYESWLERERLVLLVRAPEVMGIASQPFWLHWNDSTRKRRHAPDSFVRLVAGRGRVVEVRAEEELDGNTRERMGRLKRRRPL
ncbi:TnsA-like heteromeric transposase endonuclease subunit [Streptomyces sp. NPDC048438]|uniref:TnsA-like heteromeric transposase endonuclease subunit n=1 Tax=Streptomyces sp. NPDC048438 TaxID=3365551 RepID=UPI0037169F8B